MNKQKWTRQTLAQAVHLYIRDELPAQSERDYILPEFVAAVYYVDHADRYQSVFARERAEAGAASRGRRMRDARRMVPRLELRVGPTRTVDVYVDDEGYIVTRGGEWDDVASQVPGEWIAAANEVRS